MDYIGYTVMDWLQSQVIYCPYRHPQGEKSLFGDVVLNGQRKDLQ